MTAGPPAGAPPVRRLVIWRHGRTEWNAAGRFQGQLDPPLDEVGRAQAARTAPALAATLPAGATVLVSSDLQRAADTAGALAALLGLPVRIDPRLREHGLGSWEGLTRAEVEDRYPEQYADWVAGGPVAERDGEPSAAISARALAAVADLPEAEVAVLVTHGGLSSRLVGALLGLGPEHRRVFGPLGNCSWSELSHSASGWRLMRHNVSVPGPSADGFSGADGRAGASGGQPGQEPAGPEATRGAAPATDADAAA